MVSLFTGDAVSKLKSPRASATVNTTSIIGAASRRLRRRDGVAETVFGKDGKRSVAVCAEETRTPWHERSYVYNRGGQRDETFEPPNKVKNIEEPRPKNKGFCSWYRKRIISYGYN